MLNSARPFSVRRSVLAIHRVEGALQDECALEVKRRRLIKALLCDTYEVGTVSTPLARRQGVHLLPIAAPEGERQGVLFTYAEGTPLHRIQDVEPLCAFRMILPRNILPLMQ